MAASGSGRNARALTVLTVITPSRYSGAERMAVYLAEALGERGHRVVFACKRNELLLEELAARGIQAHALPISGKTNVAAPFMLGWLAKRVGADVIHTHLSSAGLWGSFGGRIAGVPTVASVHALNSKTCFVFADMVATCSDGVRHHLLGQGMSPDNIRVLHNGVRPEDFEGLDSAAAVRAELGIAADAPVIGEVAHLSARKGHRYLIEAVALLRERWPGIVCLIVGEGDERAAIERQIAELGLGESVRLLGYRHDAPRMIQAMDVVTLPSVAREGLGVCLIEAAMLGKPVVGSDAPGIREVLADGDTGLLAAVGDAQDLAVKIGALLEDRELARTMGARGREYALGRFTISRMAETAEAIYRETIAGVRREAWL